MSNKNLRTQNLGGIVFFKTKKLQRIEQFYVSRIGLSIWLRQADCLILKHGNMLIGFCQRDTMDDQGIITFVYDTNDEVDLLYEKMSDSSIDTPHENSTYNIYQFFARDPDGRLVEFQAFLHAVPPLLAGDDLLRNRRSIRLFSDETVPYELLMKVLELCRFAPTSRNCESCTFTAIRDQSILKRFSELRGTSSAPIGRASLAIAVSADPKITKRPKQDADIAAYHLLQAAWLHGLGTCWIAAMDRSDVKQILGIPLDHYVATVTPLGFPAELPSCPSKRPVESYLRMVDGTGST